MKQRKMFNFDNITEFDIEILNNNESYNFDNNKQLWTPKFKFLYINRDNIFSFIKSLFKKKNKGNSIDINHFYGSYQKTISTKNINNILNMNYYWNKLFKINNKQR